MILLNTVLDKVITSNLIWGSIGKILPKILPIIIFIIIRLFAPNGFKFCWDMIRNK